MCGPRANGPRGSRLLADETYRNEATVRPVVGTGAPSFRAEIDRIVAEVGG